MTIPVKDSICGIGIGTGLKLSEQFAGFRILYSPP